MPLYLPPLRERPEDIPEISRHLLAKIGAQQKRKLSINDTALRSLAHYEWPGNVRELENCLERAAVLSEDGVIDTSLIRFPQRERTAPRPTRMERPTAPDAESAAHENEEISERQRIINALEQAGGVQAKAARLLNMTPRQIAYRIQTLNIELKQI
jgi:Nif-specific regulatory protein